MSFMKNPRIPDRLNGESRAFLQSERPNLPAGEVVFARGTRLISDPNAGRADFVDSHGRDGRGTETKPA